MLLTPELLSKLPQFFSNFIMLSLALSIIPSLSSLALHWILSLSYWVLKDRTHGELQPTHLVCGLQPYSMCTVASNHTFRDRFYQLIIVCWTDRSLVIKLQVLADMINRDISCCYFCCQAIWMQGLLVNSQECDCNNPKRAKPLQLEDESIRRITRVAISTIFPGPLLTCSYMVIFLFWGLDLDILDILVIKYNFLQAKSVSFRFIILGNAYIKCVSGRDGTEYFIWN